MELLFGFGCCSLDKSQLSRGDKIAAVHQQFDSSNSSASTDYNSTGSTGSTASSTSPAGRSARPPQPPRQSSYRLLGSDLDDSPRAQDGRRASGACNQEPGGVRARVEPKAPDSGVSDDAYMPLHLPDSREEVRRAVRKRNCAAPSTASPRSDSRSLWAGKASSGSVAAFSPFNLVKQALGHISTRAGSHSSVSTRAGSKSSKAGGRSSSSLDLDPGGAIEEDRAGAARPQVGPLPKGLPSPGSALRARRSRAGLRVDTAVARSTLSLDELIKPDSVRVHVPAAQRASTGLDMRRLMRGYH